MVGESAGAAGERGRVEDEGGKESEDGEAKGDSDVPPTPFSSSSGRTSWISRILISDEEEDPVGPGAVAIGSSVTRMA